MQYGIPNRKKVIIKNRFVNYGYSKEEFLSNYGFENEEAFIDLGDIYMATDDTDSAIKSYCSAITINPKKVQAYNKCAMALWQKDYIEEAIIAYHKALGIDPTYAAAYNNLGVIYLDDLGRVKQAIELFKKAVETNPNYALAHFNLARAVSN